MHSRNALSTDPARVQDAAHILRIRAPALPHLIARPRIPQHHPREPAMRLVRINERRHPRRRDVRLRVRHRRRGPSEETHEDLGAPARALAHLLAPRVVIDVRVRRARRVVVELDPQEVERGVFDEVSHIRLGDEALRRAGDLILAVVRVLGEEGAELIDRVFEVGVVAAFVAFEVEVEAVDDLLAERPGRAAAAAIAVPEALGDLLAFLLARDGAPAVGAAEADEDLFAGGLAGLDVGRDVGTRRVSGGVEAGGAEVAGELRPVAPVLDRAQDQNVDARVAGAILAKSLFAVHLAPVDNLLKTRGLSAVACCAACVWKWARRRDGCAFAKNRCHYGPARRLPGGCWGNRTIRRGGYDSSRICIEGPP